MWVLYVPTVDRLRKMNFDEKARELRHGNETKTPTASKVQDLKEQQKAGSGAQSVVRQ